MIVKQGSFIRRRSTTTPVGTTTMRGRHLHSSSGHHHHHRLPERGGMVPEFLKSDTSVEPTAATVSTIFRTDDRNTTRQFSLDCSSDHTNSYNKLLQQPLDGSSKSDHHSPSSNNNHRSGYGMILIPPTCDNDNDCSSTGEESITFADSSLERLTKSETTSVTATTYTTTTTVATSVDGPIKPQLPGRYQSIDKPFVDNNNNNSDDNEEDLYFFSDQQDTHATNGIQQEAGRSNQRNRRILEQPNHHTRDDGGTTSEGYGFVSSLPGDDIFDDDSCDDNNASENDGCSIDLELRLLNSFQEEIHREIELLSQRFAGLTPTSVVGSDLDEDDTDLTGTTTMNDYTPTISISPVTPRRIFHNPQPTSIETLLSWNTSSSYDSMSDVDSSSLVTEGHRRRSRGGGHRTSAEVLGGISLHRNHHHHHQHPKQLHNYHQRRRYHSRRSINQFSDSSNRAGPSKVDINESFVTSPRTKKFVPNHDHHKRSTIERKDSFLSSESSLISLTQEIPSIPGSSSSQQQQQQRPSVIVLDTIPSGSYVHVGLVSNIIVASSKVYDQSGYNSAILNSSQLLVHSRIITSFVRNRLVETLPKLFDSGNNAENEQEHKLAITSQLVTKTMTSYLQEKFPEFQFPLSSSLSTSNLIDTRSRRNELSVVLLLLLCTSPLLGSSTIYCREDDDAKSSTRRRRNRRNRGTSSNDMTPTNSTSSTTTNNHKSIPSSGVYVRMMNDYLYRMMHNDETVHEIEEIVE